MGDRQFRDSGAEGVIVVGAPMPPPLSARPARACARASSGHACHAARGPGLSAPGFFSLFPRNRGARLEHMACARNTMTLASLALMGLFAACGGPARETATVPPHRPAPTPKEPAPPPKSTGLSGVPVYDPSAPRTPPPPELHGTMKPVILPQCTDDDRLVVKALINKSSSAYVEARHDEAIRLSRRALSRCKHDDSMTYQIIGAASCARNDAATARWAHAKIPADKRGLIEKVCLGVGIELILAPVRLSPRAPPSDP